MWQSRIEKNAGVNEMAKKSANLVVEKQLQSLLNEPSLENFDWDNDEFEDAPLVENLLAYPSKKQIENFRINDDTLRDGLGGLHIVPTAKDSIAYIEAAYALGIKNQIVAIYAGEGTKSDLVAREILAHFARHVVPDLKFLVTIPLLPPAVQWAKECVAYNPEQIAIAPFIGTAPSRLFIENWSKESVLERIYNSISELKNTTYKLRCVIEHATQTPPDFLEQIISTQVQASGGNLESIILADTIGCGTPAALARIFRFARNVLEKNHASQIPLELHAHNDLGMALPNALSALEAGATYIDTTARGVGERAGNLSAESLLLTLFKLQKKTGAKLNFDLSELENYVRAFHKLSGLPESSYGVLSANSYVTGYGTHAAALEKYRQLQVYSGEQIRELQAQLAKLEQTKAKIERMANTLYSAVNPELVGKKNEIVAGPQIGTGGLAYILSQHNLSLPKEKLLQLRDLVAKENGVISDEQLLTMAKRL